MRPPDTDLGPFGHDIVGFMEHHLPAAIEYAERERLATRRARAANLSLMLRRGYCPLRHVIPVAMAGRVTTLELAETLHAPDAGCGYCQSAVEHARMWAPPDPTALVALPTRDPSCRP